MLSLKREDRDKECEIIADMADRIEAIQRSMNIRVAPETVKLTFGFSNRAWEYLFPGAKKPKELEDFKGVNGKNHQAPTTPVDLFLHVRADEASTTYLVVDQIMGFLRPIVDVVDETHGFHYREGRAIIDFIDGTENPVGEEAKEWAIIGAQDGHQHVYAGRSPARVLDGTQGTALLHPVEGAHGAHRRGRTVLKRNIPLCRISLLRRCANSDRCTACSKNVLVPHKNPAIPFVGVTGFFARESLIK